MAGLSVRFRLSLSNHERGLPKEGGRRKDIAMNLTEIAATATFAIVVATILVDAMRPLGRSVYGPIRGGVAASLNRPRYLKVRS